MEPSADPSQYGNVKGISVQHCLIQMLDKIYTQLDVNNQKEVNAAIIALVDYSRAFDRQCPRLAIESFMKNGVRKPLIPLLISFFQNRRMHVKWKGYLSTQRSLPGGGPQGSTTGLLSYKSTTNDNCDFVPVDDRYKWVDDLSLMEIINLLSIGLTAFNFYNQVASDIGVDDQYLSNENLNMQLYLDKLVQWSNDHQMKINPQKTKLMVINFSKKHQFATRVYLENQLLEIVSETKLLGCIITSDLKFEKNTEYIIKKAYTRMSILHRLYSFNLPVDDLVHIYIMYIRSILEQNVAVWHHSLTVDNSEELERVQKVALKIILKENYLDYPKALKETNLQSLKERRKILCLRFAKGCVKNPKTSHMFPLNENFNPKLRFSKK